MWNSFMEINGDVN